MAVWHELEMPSGVMEDAKGGFGGYVFESPWSPGVCDVYWLVVSNIFHVHPYLGKIPNLTNIFQMGWNHQLN